MSLVVISVEDLTKLVREAVRDEIAKMRDAAPVWLTLEETAQLLKVSTKSVRSFIRDRGLKASRAGASWRFARADVEAWLQERATAPAAHGRKHLATLRQIRGGKEE